MDKTSALSVPRARIAPTLGSHIRESAESPIPCARIAPSPSGRMHAGNVFAALMSWLIARRAGGRVVLRIENLDPERDHQEFADQMMRDLEWLGLSWDGPVVYQSERTDAYEEAFEQLRRCGLIYPCFCTRADLHAASAPHTADGDIVYPGTCRGLSAVQIAEHSRTHTPAMRLAVPSPGDKTGHIRFHDELQGSVEADLGEACGDFIVRRSDGVFAYQLAVVVDDLAQGVNRVVRGCDLLASTPQQLYLRSLLTGNADDGCETRHGAMTESEAESRAPAAENMRFYHIPLIVGPDGRRLSKRNHDCDMGFLRERFRTPEALLGHLARVTHMLDDGNGTPAASLASTSETAVSLDGASRAVSLASTSRATVSRASTSETAVSLEELLERFSLETFKLRWAIEWF